MLKYAVLTFFLLASAALAADEPQAMVDFTVAVVVDDAPIIDDIKCPANKDGKRPCATPVTLGELCFLFLERPTQDQNWMTAVKRDDFARAIRSAKAFPMLDDQRKMIEDALGPFLSPGIIGAVNRLLPRKK